MATPAVHWWKASLLIFTVGSTFAGAGWLALSQPQPQPAMNTWSAYQPREVVTSTRAS